jgi:dihydrofolate reductase
MPHAVRTSVFVGTSLDGFIARPDGSLDWLTPFENTQDHGYAAFMSSVDVIVIGRHTFETVASFPTWPYGGTPVVVLSSRPLGDASADAVKRVTHLSGAPAEVLASLADRGFKHAYIDGGVTIQRFLEAGLIERLIVTRVPVLIGRGRPLFGPLARDVRLRHVATRTYPSGLVQSEYEIDRAVQPS